MAGGSKEGQYVRALARWLADHPAEDGLAYPALLGGSRDDVREDLVDVYSYFFCLPSMFFGIFCTSKREIF